MTKNQFRQLAKELGYSTAYSGHSKTFYLNGKVTQDMEDLNIQQKCLELQFSGFKVVYQ